MKKLLAIASFLLVACFTLSAVSIRIAITQIEPIGVKKEVARSVEELLQTDFSKNPMFQLVERSQLDALLKEQELQLSGITSAESATEAGKILNVNKVIFGTISNYDSEYIKYLLSLRLVDVEKGSVVAAETIQIRTSEEIVKAASEITERLSRQIKIEGKVARIAEDKVYTTLGTDSGVSPEMVLGVTERKLIKDNKGKVIMHEDIPVANLVVENASTEGSRCRILEKGKEIKTGYYVQKGKIKIELNKKKATLKVGSVPENAKVYLNTNFTGVTPLTLTDLDPGKYMVEIRSGAGYKPYKGRVNLKAGSNITLERELEPEIEIEDLLLMGKLPRKQTDPLTAFKKSLIPGMGMAYNGYKMVAPLVGFSSVFNIAMGVILLAWNGLPSTEAEKSWDQIEQNVASGGAPYQDYRTYYHGKPGLIDDLESDLPVTIGMGLFVYATSLIDSFRTAKDNFLYPSYVEFSVTGFDTAIKQVQTQETFASDYDPAFMDIITKGAIGNTYGMNLNILLEGRKYLYWIGIGFAYSATLIDFLCQYRFLSWEHSMFGLGYEVNGNAYGIKNFYWNGDISPSFPFMYTPLLSFSYRGKLFEGDIIASPITLLMAPAYYVKEGSKTIDTVGEGFNPTKPMLGPIVRVNANYFFNMKMGIHLEVHGAYLYNLDRVLIDKGFTDIDTLQFITGGLGMIYRF